MCCVFAWSIFCKRGKSPTFVCVAKLIIFHIDSNWLKQLVDVITYLRLNTRAWQVKLKYWACKYDSYCVWTKNTLSIISCSCWKTSKNTKWNRQYNKRCDCIIKNSSRQFHQHYQKETEKGSLTDLLCCNYHHTLTFHGLPLINVILLCRVKENHFLNTSTYIKEAMLLSKNTLQI